MEYNFREIEKKWQKQWAEMKTYQVTEDKSREKFYVLNMFPYPSGAGLHVGHPLGYIASDIYARYKRLMGYNVLNPMGYDAYGLPAEQYAIQTGQHPAITTAENISRYRSQLDKIGFSFDWNREVRTCEPKYYKWTQWAFQKMFNSFYCNTCQKAQPIEKLIEHFSQKGTEGLDVAQSEEMSFTAAEWNAMSEKEQQQVLMNYRIAYLGETMVNWCAGLGTVLANDEVVDGVSVRGGYPVVQKKMMQWCLRVSAYAQRLLDGLDTVDWTESLKETQRNWIGRSEGTEMQFKVAGQDWAFTIFTTRADTIFGVTFMVLAPESELVEKLTTPEQKAEVDAYIERTKKRTERERISDRSVTGVFSGSYAINPFTGENIPIWISDYVLAGYGTGAIMAVPAHDSRDYAFAKHFGLEIRPLIEGCDVSEESFDAKEGTVCNSPKSGVETLDGFSLNGLSVKEAIKKTKEFVTSHNMGRVKVNYRLRDAIFSRQRYWGEPFPIVYGEDGTPHLLPDEQLPINLPDVPDYSPKTFDPEDAESNPEAPLSRNEDWVKVELDLGDGKKTYYRDTNTMPNWAGSCWYYMRYLDPTDTKHMVEKDEFDYWMGPDHNKTAGKSGGVDLYIGGVEHAVLHLLYSRFWHKVLFDLGYVDSMEPFHKLFNQGMIQAYAYTDDRGQYVPAAEVVEGPADANGEPTFTWNGQHANREFGKMGKSLKNIITPDDMYENYGADTFRLYEMGMGPLAESRPWNTRNVVGSMRFLQRLWRNVIDETTGEVRVTDGELDTKTLKLLNNTIADVTVEMEAMRPNTAIAKLIVLNNHLTSLDAVPRAAVEPLILMLSPIAPHICEELWSKLGHTESLAHADWPKADERYVGQDSVTAVVQIKGKVRAKLEVSPDIDPKELEKMALEAVADRLGGKEPRKVIVKAPKIVSIVPAE